MTRTMIQRPGVSRKSVFGRPPEPLLLAFGNSWIANAITQYTHPAKHFPSVVHAMLRGRAFFSPSLNFGYAGAASPEIVTHLPELIAAAAGRGGYVLVEMLINNYANSVAHSQSVADVREVTKRLNEVGLVPIFGTIAPRSDASNTASLRNYNNKLNDALWAEMAVRPRGTLYVADVASAITSRTSSAGAPVSLALGADGVHPIDYGGALIAQPYFEILDKLLPSALPWPAWRTTGFDRTENPTGWRGTADCYGTAGTIASGGSGSLADYWNLSRDSGTVLNAVCSKVAGLNGGDYQQLVLGASGLGAGREQLSISGAITPAVGDEMFGFADIEFSGLSNVLGIFVSLNGVIMGMNDSGISGDKMQASGKWALITPRYTAPNTTSITYRLNIACKTSDMAPTGTIIIKRMGFKLVSVA